MMRNRFLTKLWTFCHEQKLMSRKIKKILIITMSFDQNPRKKALLLLRLLAFFIFEVLNIPAFHYIDHFFGNIGG